MIELKAAAADQSISFKAEEGTMTGIRGSEGAASVLDCLYRTVIPESGQIWYDSSLYGSLDLTKAAIGKIVKLRIHEMRQLDSLTAMIPQYRFSVLDIVAERLLHLGGSVQQAKKDSQTLLERLRINEQVWHASPAECSNEQRQYIYWARALVARPRLFILQETAANLLDGESKQAILSILQEMALKGTTVIGIFEEAGLWEKAASQMVDTRKPASSNERAVYSFPALTSQ
ncbi:ATP-binding cassette domain-containing protein [Paenibacillus nasutitermitis]|uniref:ATP-binding cassette domain-containing protein n=1 Tax=Paenibacillus nasutitermitis TaxID=1652958 RepID=UPI001E370FAB|nr:ATP-binding cassette domain-containing protein [Paenibacillus nasutitermitis]